MIFITFKVTKWVILYQTKIMDLKTKSIGLILSGGGSKGLAQAGANGVKIARSIIKR